MIEMKPEELAKCKNATCQNVIHLNDGPVMCGSIYYQEVFVMKLVLPPMSAEPNGEIVPVKRYICANCLLPLGRKSKDETVKNTTELPSLQEG